MGVLPEEALLDVYPQRYPQQRHRSAWANGAQGPTGLLGIHSAESVVDRILPDTGAENVFNYILTRVDPGSYHVLVDFDTVLRLARWSMMTWNVAADSLNGVIIGMSFACRSVDFNVDDWWTQKTMGTMGGVIRECWTDLGKNIPESTRWLTRSDVSANGGRIAGLVHHGTVQPGDRSDAWATHPQRGELDAMLLNAIDNTLVINPPTTPPEDEDMPLNDMDKADIKGIVDAQGIRTAIYIDGKLREHKGTFMASDPRGAVFELEHGTFWKRWVIGPEEFDTLIAAGVPFHGGASDSFLNSRVLQPEGVSEGYVATLSEINERLRKLQEVFDLPQDDQDALKEMKIAADAAAGEASS
jgi:hypothetical protein